MSVRSLNGLAGSSTTNVYVNTIDVFTGTSPVVVAQANPNEQVNISLKDINGFGGANKILAINGSNNGLVWGDQNWERVASAYLQPADITDIVSIPPDSYIRFDTNPISALGYELKHDQTNNDFVFRKKDGTQIYKYTPTGQFNAYSFEFGETDNERIVLSQNNLRINNGGNLSFREDAVNGTNQINLKAPAGLASSATITLPSSNGTLALVGQGGFITSVSSPLAVSSNNLTLGTVPISKGGTNLTSYTTGDIIYSSATDTLAKRGIGSTGQVLKVSGGIPVWDDETDTVYTGTGNIDITGTTISLTGTIPQSNGGTGFNTYTVGDLLYCSSSNTLSKLPIGATDKVLKVSGGVPVWGTDTDTVYTVNTPITLTNSTEIGLTTVPYNLGGTGLTSYTEGDLLYASADNVLAKLPHGSSGDILRMNGTGTLPEWRTMYTATSPIVLTGGTTFELTAVPENLGGTGQSGYNSGDMLFCNVANTLTKINIGSAGQVLKVSSATTLPAWEDETDTTYTATAPLFVAGTNFTLSTVPIIKGGTNIVSYTEGDILYCSSSVGQGTLSKLPIGSTGDFLKVSGGIPVWGSDNDTVYTVNTPITLTNSTEIGLTTVPYNLGGTGLTSYTEGDLLYASADNVLAKLPHGNSGDILRMNGTGTLPEWRTMYGATSPIVLTGGLTFELNTVPVSKGGTGFTGCNAGDMIYSLVANTLTKLNIGSTGQVLKVSGGLPVWSNETDTTYTGTGNIDITGTTISLTGTIPQSNGGTGFNTYTVGDILYCDTTNTLSKLPIGTTGQVLKVDSGKPSWGALSGATPFTTSGNLLYPTDTNLRLLVGATANSNDYKLRVNGDAYINGPTYIEQSTHFGIRLIRSGYNGICWYASEADAQGDTNRKAYIQADTGSNGKMFFNCLSQQFIFGTSSSIGRIGVNKSNPQFPLDVDHTLNDTSASVNYRYITTLSAGGPVQVYNTTAKFDGRIWITDVIYNSSDRRIKENINELNSSKSLEIIDKLKVCEYTMKDIKRNGNAKHLGFIAQEVEAEYPLAVNDSNEYIPDIYKNVDCVYTKVGEEYKVKISELGEVSGVEYSFYVWVGEEDRNEISLELVGNEDNTFTFEKEYENVFCYGKKVSDFKTLEKETLYDLNVSATQELHNKIKTLETELTTYKSIVDKLINSKSFAEFKKSL